MISEAWKQLQESQGKYILINALSRRIRDLHSGHKPLVNRPTTDLTALAAEELRQNKLTIRKVDKRELPEQTDEQAASE